MAGTVDGVSAAPGENLAAVEIELAAAEVDLSDSSVEVVAGVVALVVGRVRLKCSEGAGSSISGRRLNQFVSFLDCLFPVHSAGVVSSRQSWRVFA